MYHFSNPTINGRFLERLNRFVARVEVADQISLAHIPNSGRLEELLFPGNRVVLEKQLKPGRKTAYELIMADFLGNLVSIDSRLPNFLVAEAIEQKVLADFIDFRVERREVVYGQSRLDIKLTGRAEGFCEVKSVTLVKDGVAYFPDAPTLRGVKHLRELIQASKEGYRAFVIFLIQRSDAFSFSPNRETDPLFAMTLKEAIGCGVQARAYNCHVSLEGMAIKEQIMVKV